MLYMRKPHLEWEHTASIMPDQDEQELRARFMAQRGKQLTRTDSQRDLDTLRVLLSDRRDVTSTSTSPTSTPLNSPQLASTPDSATTGEPQRAYALTVPEAPNGSFTLGNEPDEELSPGQQSLNSPAFTDCVKSAVFTYACGDDISAEATLLQSIEHHPERAAELYVYLLDLYQATRQIQPYNAAAQLYARKSGKAMPLWHAPGARSASEPLAGLAAAFDSDVRHVLPTVMHAKDAGQLLRYITECVSNTKMPQIDCAALTVIEADACGQLSLAIDRIADSVGHVQISALHKLSHALDSPWHRGGGGHACDWQRARLALFRLTGDASAYAHNSQSFSELCRLPAPEWMPPRCVLLSSRPPATNAHNSTLGSHEICLEGSYTRSQLAQVLCAQDAFIQLAQTIHVNAGQLHRLDVDAAHDLIVWTGELRRGGKQIRVSQLNHLVAHLLRNIDVEATEDFETHRRYS
jgi:ABC-type transporter Mla MlaB component